MPERMNRRIVLAARPTGMVAESNFRFEEVPVAEPRHGEVLVRGIYLSLDPYMRGRMRDAPSYAPPVQLGEVMVGGLVGEVMASRNEDFAVGDIVEERLGWQSYAISNGRKLRKIDPKLAPICTANGVLGMTGLTAYFGLLDVAGPKPGETVAVSAASGAVGAAVGQLARIAGCRVVGLAGSDAKVDYVLRELGFDAAINYRKEKDLDAALARACPDGIDVYFDNVGGAIYDAVTRQLNMWARIAVCGSISQYNLAKPELAPYNTSFLVGKRVRQQGFIVWDFENRWGAALRHMGGWYRSGRLKEKQDIVQGLENAPKAFTRLFKGENFGKLQVQIGPEPK